MTISFTARTADGATIVIPVVDPVVIPKASAPTTITGAAINGVLQRPLLLTDLVSSTPVGGTLALPAGTWGGAASISKVMTIAGAGAGVTVIEATGLGLAAGKGIFCPLVAGCTFSNMTLRGAAVPDDNGAAIRENADGCGYTATGLEITGCQDGILSFKSNITMNNCSVHDNGASDGLSHEMYFNGSPTSIVTLTNLTSVCGLKSTHALKCRAGILNVTGGSYSGNPDDGTVGGSVIDVPQGGIVSISGAHITVTTQAGGVNAFLGFGMENSLNGTGGYVTLRNVHVTDKSGTGGVFLCGTHTPGATLIIGSGCVYDGTKPPQISGWHSVSGSFSAV